MTDEIDNFLEDEPVVEDEAQAETETAETETVETGEAPTAPEENSEDSKTVPISALMGVKDDLKRTKAELEEYKRQTASQSAPREKQDFFDNPDEILAQHERRVLNNTSEMLARSKYGDYDDKVTRFAEMVNENPALLAQMNSSSNPAEYVYQVATKDLQLQEVGSLEEYKAKLEADYQERIKAFEAKAKGEELPPSMVDVRSSATPVKGDEVDTLDSILNG